MHHSTCAWPLFAEAFMSARVTWLFRNTDPDPMNSLTKTLLLKINVWPWHVRFGRAPTSWLALKSPPAGLV